MPPSKCFALRIFDLPDPYINSINIQSASFNEAMKELFNDAYGQANYIGVELTKSGYPTIELVPNFKKVQVKWATEQSITIKNSNNWKLEILEAQILFYKPELLFFVGWNYGGEYIKELKEKFPFVKRIIFWVGESLPDIKFMQHFDSILSCDSNNIAFLSSQGKRAFQIHHAFSSSLDKKLSDNAKSNHVLFSGSIKYGESEHNRRAELVNLLLEKSRLILHGNSYFPPIYAKSIKGRLLSVYHNFIDLFGENDTFKKKLPYIASYFALSKHRSLKNVFENIEANICPPLWGLNHLQSMKNSLVTFNVHSNSPFACNMRMFEATGVGSCLLTDYRSNLPELFEIDSEIVCYKSEGELIEKARFLLDNPSIAINIGKQGQAKTQMSHSYEKRAPIYVNILENILNE